MQTQSLVGAIIDGKFELLAVAGSGGMGTVYTARQVDLDRLVAVKILEHELLKDEDSLKRFEREARSISQLSHAHIAGFYAYGLWEQVPYLAMEWLDGLSLSSTLAKEERMTADRAAKIAEQIADALDAVHKQGIVHRDLKPANIILLDKPEADFVKLVDFGLARIAEASGQSIEELTRTGTLIGTPDYLSPEQCQGSKADARSDIYALGCIMYQMLVGQAPFQADNPIGVLHKHVNEKVPTLANRLPEPAPQIERIITKCLQKNPADRYQSVSELREDLATVLSGREVQSKPVSGLSAEALDLRRKVLIARYATAAVLVLGLVGFIAYQWSASEAGSVSKAEMLLKTDHSKQAVLESLDLAEKLAAQGKYELFQRIKKAADLALKFDSIDAKARLKSCLSLASDLQKRGDNYCAFTYGTQAIKTIDELKGRVTKAGLADSTAFSISSLEQASIIVLKSGVAAKKNWENSPFADRDLVKKAVNLCAESLAVNPSACEHSSKLVNLFISKTSPALSDNVLICILSEAWFMAAHGQVAQLDACINKKLETLNKFQGLSKMRLVPKPCAVNFLYGLGFAFLQAKNNSAAERYAQKAEELLNKVDLNSLDGLQKTATACAWSGLSLLYQDHLDDKEESLRCARVSVSLVPLQDDNSAGCYKQFARCLALQGLNAEAEPVAASVYNYFKSRDWDGATMINRVDTAVDYSGILFALHKDRQSTKVLSEEISEQKKHFPDSVIGFARLNTILAQYYSKHSQPGRAAECNRRISEVMSLLKGDDRLNFDALLMERPSDDPKIAKVALADALAYIDKANVKEVSPALLASFARMLRFVEPGSELATKCLQNAESGCLSMLDAAVDKIDPFSLADIINLLGINGAESTADKIRSAAMEKLSAEKTGPFSAYCIDFVANADAQSGAKYSAPDHAVSVFLDLAHDMQNKDNQSAGKYAFEALKIIRVLVASNANLAKSLLDKANDASNVILETKALPDQYQFDSVIDLCTMELDASKESTSSRLFDLFTECLKKKDYPYSDKIVSGIFVVDDFLANKKQFTALQALASSTKSDIVKFYNSGILLAEHYSDIANLIASQPATAHWFLSQSARLLEEMTPEQVALDPSRVATIWERDSLAASKTNDLSLALAYSRKAMAIRPLQDHSSGLAASALCDALFNAKRFPEGEKLAREFYSFAMAQKDLSAQSLELRFLAVQDLYKVLDVQGKAGEAQNILSQECLWRSKHFSPQPFEPAQLNITLAFHKLIHESPQAAYPYMEAARKYASSIRGDRRSHWYASVMQRHVINIAAKANDAATCSAAYNEMMTANIPNKGDALLSPSGWWSSALSCFKKSGDNSSFTGLLELVKQGYSQLLSGKNPDAGYLGEIAGTVASLGDATTADAMKEMAQKTLPETVMAQFTARSNAPVSPAVQNPEPEPKTEGDEKDAAPQGAPETEGEGKQ